MSQGSIGHTYCLLHYKANKYGIGYGQNFFRGICFFLNITHVSIFNIILQRYEIYYDLY